MPRYDYECVTESRIFEIHQAFADQALTTCPDCGGNVRKKIVGILFGAGTHDTSSNDAVFSRKFEKNLEKDRPAYKAMREQGLRPARMMGAHELMTKAETRYEIESGNILPGKAKEIESVLKMYEDQSGGKSLLKANTTPKKMGS